MLIQQQLQLGFRNLNIYCLLYERCCCGYRVSEATHHRWEHRTRSIITRKTGLGFSRAVVNNDCRSFGFHFWKLKNPLVLFLIRRTNISGPTTPLRNTEHLIRLCWEKMAFARLPLQTAASIKRSNQEPRTDPSCWSALILLIFPLSWHNFTASAFYVKD